MADTMEYLRTAEAAGYIGLQPSTLKSWRVMGEGPAYVSFGRAVLYRRNDLDEFMASRIVRPTAG